MGWDSNWASTEAFEKRLVNVLIQLSEGLMERWWLASGSISALLPRVVTKWDSTKTYNKWKLEFVYKDFVYKVFA